MRCDAIVCDVWLVVGRRGSVDVMLICRCCTRSRSAEPAQSITEGCQIPQSAAALKSIQYMQREAIATAVATAIDVGMKGEERDKAPATEKRSKEVKKGR